MAQSCPKYRRPVLVGEVESVPGGQDFMSTRGLLAQLRTLARQIQRLEARQSAHRQRGVAQSQQPVAEVSGVHLRIAPGTSTPPGAGSRAGPSELGLRRPTVARMRW